MTHYTKDVHAKTLVCGDCDHCPFRGDPVLGPTDEVEDLHYRQQLAALVYTDKAEVAIYPTRNDGHSQAWFVDASKTGGAWHCASSDVYQAATWVKDWASWHNVSVATGSVSRLLVIDLDPGLRPIQEILKNVNRGVQSFTTWEKEHDVYAPRDALVATPSNGYHIWLRLPPWLTAPIPTVIGWLPNVDLICENRNVKAPPSVRINKTPGEYKFIMGCPCQVPEAPADLLAAILQTMKDDPDVNSKIPGSDYGSSKIPVDVEKLLADGAPYGDQDNVFHAVACKLARKSFSEDDIVAVLAGIAAVSKQDPSWPWETKHFESKAQNAIAFIVSDRANERKTSWKRYAS